MAIEDTIATFALVGATLVLGYHTRALYKATNVLGQIEKKRDLRQARLRRLEYAEEMLTTESMFVREYLSKGGTRASGPAAEAAATIRGLRTTLSKLISKPLTELAFSLDNLIHMMDRDFAEGGDITGVEKEVNRQVESIKGQLRNLIVSEWRKEIQADYSD